MKHFVITYRLSEGNAASWHDAIQNFITALDGDAEIAGRISYRCMRIKDGPDYIHLAAAADDEAIKLLQSRDYFQHYTEESKRVSGGGLEVRPLMPIAETRRVL
jgi:hypothetical protein